MTLRDDFLFASLRDQAKRCRAQAALCRVAYRTEPMRGYCETLADAYEEAAAAFEKRLRAEAGDE